jgi:undecaprenyl-diphosphatase
VMEVVNQVAGYDATAMALALVAAVILMARGRGRAGILTLAVAGLGYFAVTMMQGAIARERPPDARNLVSADEMLHSFPARNVFLFTLAIALLMFALWDITPGRLLRGVLVVVSTGLVVLLCLSQFYLGLHFVTDVVAGLVGGLLLALLARSLSPPPATSPGSAAGPPGTR